MDTERFWVNVQKKTFTNWTNDRLKKTDYKIETLEEDFEDGIKLIALLQCLAPDKKFPKYHAKPRMPIHKNENLSIAFRFMTEIEKIPLVNIGPQDIIEHNLKLILGLVWSLILRYQISSTTTHTEETPKTGEGAEQQEVKATPKISAKKLLQGWANAVLSDLPVSNFTTDWNNGIRLSALVDHCQPGLIPNYASLDPHNALQNIDNAMSLAEKHLNIPKVLQPEDLAVPKPDELSVMTYVSYFCLPDSSFLNHLKVWINQRIPKPVSNFTTDWTDGCALGALTDAVSGGDFSEYEAMTPDNNVENCRRAMEAAERLLHIERPFTPEEFTSPDLDQLLRVTYLTRFMGATPSCSPARGITVSGPGISGSLTGSETSFDLKGRVPVGSVVEVSVTSPDGSKVPLRCDATSGDMLSYFYTPTIPGGHVVEVKVGGDHISASPLIVRHLLPSSTCVAGWKGLGEGRVGQQACLSVDCKRGGRGEMGGLQVKVEGPSGPVDPAMKTTMGEKVFAVTFTPQEAGPHKVSVMWDNSHIPGSPFEYNVTDPSACSVLGLEEKVMVGQEQQFEVTADRAGKGDLTVEGVGSGGAPIVPVDIQEDRGSRYLCRYTLRDLGNYIFHVKWSGASIRGSPFKVQGLQPPSASSCTVMELPAGRLQVGKLYSFTVDTSGAGSGELSVRYTYKGAPVHQDCDMKEVGPGVFLISFVPHSIGLLYLEPTYSGTVLSGAPFEFQVNDPSKCAVSMVNTLKAKNFYSKCPISFECSTQLAGEGRLSAVVVSGHGAEEMIITAGQGGSHLCSYQPRGEGEHTVSVSFDKVLIPNMPLVLQVLAGSPADWVQVTLPPAGDFGAYLVGVAHQYKVDTSRAGVGTLTATGRGEHTGTIPTIMVVGAEPEAVEYRVAMETTTPDQYTINIKWGEEGVPGSPFLIKVEDRPHADRVTVEGPHHVPGSHDPIKLAINAEKAGAGELKVTCNGGKVGAVPVEIQQLQPRVFSVSIVPMGPDTYTIEVLWANMVVPRSPFKVDTTPPDASKCKVSGPDIPLETFKPVELVVDASEAGNGNLTAEAVGVETKTSGTVEIKEESPKRYVVHLCTSSPDTYLLMVKWVGQHVQGSPFTLNLHPPNATAVTIAQPPTQTVEAGQHIMIAFNTSKAGRGGMTGSCVGTKVGDVPLKLTERQPSLWEVKFAPPCPDIYTLVIKWAEHHVRGSPFTINLMPVDISKIKTIGPTLPGGIGGPVELMVVTRDAGKGKVTATASGIKAGGVVVKISETGQDTFLVTFAPPRPDIYSLEVQFGGQTVKGSPFCINTLPSDANGVVVVAQSGPHELGKPIVFSCNTSNAGSGKLAASCRGEKHGLISLDIAETDSDHYTISFTPYSHDRYNIRIEWSGAEVRGSPFRVNLLPISPDKVKVGDLFTPNEVGAGDCVYIDVDFSEAGPGVLSGWAEGDVVGHVGASVEELGPYSSRVKFLPNVADIYRFNVCFAERPVRGSPFSVNLLPPDGTKVEVMEKVLPLEGVGPVSLAFDVSKVGKGLLTARATGDAVGPVASQVEHTGPGSYRVRFNPPKPDMYRVDVYWANSPIKSSPFIIDLLPPSYPEKVVCGQPAVKAIGEPVSVPIDISKAGKGVLAAECKGGKTSEPVEVELQAAAQPGTLNAMFVPREEGTYELKVLFDGKEVPGSPLSVTLVRPLSLQFLSPSLDTGALSREGPLTISSYVGELVSVVVSGGDSTSPLEAVAVGNKSGTAHLRVSRNEDGSSGIDFVPEVADQYTVTIKQKGGHVPHSPFVVSCQWKTDASKCVLFGLEECPEKPTVHQELKFGVDTTRAGSGELSATSDGPSESSSNVSKLQVLAGDRPGIYQVSYVPTVSGQHHVHLTWSGVPIPRSPVDFSIGDLRLFPFGKPVNMDMNIIAKSSDLDAHCICEENGEKLKVKISKISKDQFKFNFTPKESGVHAIHVQLKGKEITGSPFRIKIGPQPNPQGVKIVGLPELAYVNELMTFSVDVSEAGGGSLKLKAMGPKGENESTLSARSTQDHIYSVTYIPKTVGDHSFLVTWADEPVPCGPLVVPVRTKMGCRLMEEDAELFTKVWHFKAGMVVRFKISTADAGKGKLNITSKGPAKADVKILDNNNGTYTCEFMPSAPGKYTIDVLWNMQPIEGSPFFLTFKSNNNAIVAGLNLESESFRISVPHRFKLHCDSIGQGVLEVLCKPTTGSKIKVAPVPGKNSYHCEIVPLMVGPHELMVLFNGNHILGSPFKVNFDNCGDASKCRMVSSSTEQQHETGDAVNFVISTEGAGKGKLIAQVENPATKEVTPVTVTPCDAPDSFSLQFVPGNAAEYLLTVKFDGQHIMGSPFKLVFAEPQHTEQCRAEGEGLTVANADKPNRFTVHAENVGPGELNVKIEGDENVKGPNVSKLDDTTYEVDYSPSQVGMLSISVMWGDKHIPGSPFSVRSYKPTDPSLFSVFQAPSEVYTGSETKFKVTAQEGMHEGILGVSIQPVNGEAINGNTSSLGGAEYECMLPSLEPGKYEVFVRWNGSNIVGIPFTLKVTKRPMPEKIKVYGPGLNNGHVGQEGNFTVETSEGGPGTLAVRLHGPKGAFKINMRRHPNNDRTILVRYDPTIEGTYRVDVTWSDVHVPGSPFTVNIEKQAALSSSSAPQV